MKRIFGLVMLLSVVTSEVVAVNLQQRVNSSGRMQNAYERFANLTGRGAAEFMEFRNDPKGYIVSNWNSLSPTTRTALKTLAATAAIVGGVVITSKMMPKSLEAKAAEVNALLENKQKEIYELTGELDRLNIIYVEASKDKFVVLKEETKKDLEKAEKKLDIAEAELEVLKAKKAKIDKEIMNRTPSSFVESL